MIYQGSKARLIKDILPYIQNCIDCIQGNNTSSCHYLEFKGKKQSMSDWAKELGLNYFNLRSKIRNGWTIEEVIRGRRCQK